MGYVALNAGGIHTVKGATGLNGNWNAPCYTPRNDIKREDIVSSLLFNYLRK